MNLLNNEQLLSRLVDGIAHKKMIVNEFGMNKYVLHNSRYKLITDMDLVTQKQQLRKVTYDNGDFKSNHYDVLYLHMIHEYIVELKKAYVDSFKIDILNSTVTIMHGYIRKYPLFTCLTKILMDTMHQINLIWLIEIINSNKITLDNYKSREKAQLLLTFVSSLNYIDLFHDLMIWLNSSEMHKQS